MNEGTGFRELRCSNEKCGYEKKHRKVLRNPMLLGKSLLMPGSLLEIKCPRCGTVTQFESVGIEQTTH